MKRFFIIAAMAVAFSFAANAPKYALVDMEYILKNIPQYEMANEQLNQVSLRWQKEVETLSEEAATLYKNYQSEKVFLTDEQKLKREEEIVNKEKEAAELQTRYFGPESLMEPIQNDIYEAIKKLCDEKGYQVIFDRASSAGIIFASPRIDVSNEVLSKLGYSK